MQMSQGVTSHVDEGQFGDDGRWRYVFSGVINGVDADGARNFGIVCVLGSFTVDPVVQWTLRSSDQRQVTANTYPTPVYYDDGLLEYPWLGRPLHERDEEELPMADTSTTVSTTGPPQPAVVPYVGPSENEYFLFTSMGDQYYYSLYHELLNRYSGRHSTKWALNLAPGGGGAYLYQDTVNGKGWLDLSRDAPSWDAGGLHQIYFTSVSGLWAIGDGNGRYLAWSNNPAVGAYNQSLASFPLMFTTILSQALKFEFSRADGYIGP